ncbi:MAG: hypothetical protein M1833_000474 [Piccolia ochrophora]|nr:MAG: hypothetical protein M1833_000474 [Piccolia ochrophora]
MSTPKTPMTELPTDILIDILPYLDARSFLAFCSTCKALLSLQLEPRYWRYLTRSTYRLPDQPLLHADGSRWKSLYQRLQTESRAYTWGQLSLGACGHSMEPITSGGTTREATSCTWPTEMDSVRQMDPIVDIQCGGWSTTLLTSKGDLYCAGVLNGEAYPTRHSPRALSRLPFPRPYPQGHRRVPATTVLQFSSGRRHVLALSDTGRIWSWTEKSSPGTQVTFTEFDIAEDIYGTGPAEVDDKPRVRRIVAGWDCSTAYVPGQGIVVWKTVPSADPASRSLQLNHEESDGLMVASETVPNTSYIRPRGSARELSTETEEMGRMVGEVVNYVALEGYIVFLTDLGKVFAAKRGSREELLQGAFEITGCEPSTGKLKMTEIQGSFRSFAVFNTGGDVLLGDKDLLDLCWSHFAGLLGYDVVEGAPTLLRPRELQNRGIISLAFGDWHKLALTASGHILSLGREPQGCGSLGLGHSRQEAMLRGVTRSRNVWSEDCNAPPEGRRIWFSPEQREWLRYLCDMAGPEQTDAFLASGEVRDKLSQWVDANGADWDLHGKLDTPTGQTWGHEQPAYLALSISAAGWHSGALVLANTARIDRMYASHEAFLPHRQRAPVARGGSTLDGLLSRFSEWWSDRGDADDAPPAGFFEQEALRDQKALKPHAHYYSSRSRAETREALPVEARHAFKLPQATFVDGEWTLM